MTYDSSHGTTRLRRRPDGLTTLASSYAAAKLSIPISIPALLAILSKSPRAVALGAQQEGTVPSRNVAGNMADAVGTRT